MTHNAENDATVPTEAFDATHPDHEWWVGKTGRCLAGPECPAHRPIPPGACDGSFACEAETHDEDCYAPHVIPPGEGQES